MLNLSPETTVQELIDKLKIPRSEIMQVLIFGIRREENEKIGETESIDIIPTMVGG